MSVKYYLVLILYVHIVCLLWPLFCNMKMNQLLTYSSTESVQMWTLMCDAFSSLQSLSHFPDFNTIHRAYLKIL